MLDTTLWDVYYLNITDDLPHYCTARSLLALVYNDLASVVQRERNCINFESPFVVANACVRQAFQRDAACTISSASTAF